MGPSLTLTMGIVFKGEKRKKRDGVSYLILPEFLSPFHFDSDDKLFNFTIIKNIHKAASRSVGWDISTFVKNHAFSACDYRALIAAALCTLISS